MPSLTVCSKPGCPALTDGGRCVAHRRQADRQRGTAHQRGYGSRHRLDFRDAVLARDPICTFEGGCTEPSTDADHYPLSRRELEAQGADPNDPRRGRGLCGAHHRSATGQLQPGGWNAR